MHILKIYHAISAPNSTLPGLGWSDWTAKGVFLVQADCFQRWERKRRLQMIHTGGQNYVKAN